jgi:Protein of unknown function (DUF3833)
MRLLEEICMTSHAIAGSGYTRVARGLMLGFLIAILGACATIPARGPDAGSVVLERDFKGRTYAKGVFINNITGSRRGFDVVLDGRWDGRVMTLKERFAYDDGERDVKTWTFTRSEPGRYVGRREDVVGTANVYTDAGTVRISYDIVIGGTQVHFEDVIERRADGVIVNRAIVSKLGVPVGNVDLSFARRQKDLR